MKKLVKKLSMLLLILSAVGLIPVQSIEAATYTLKLTGKMEESYSPWGELFVGDPDLTPTFKKGKDGIYTLTMYDRSQVEIAIKTTTGFKALPLKKSKYIVVNTTDPDYLVISTSGIGKNKTLKETITLQLKDTRQYINGKKNPDYGKRFGSEVKLNIVVKALPETKAEAEKRKVLEELDFSQYDTDIEKIAAIYCWMGYNIRYDYDYKIYNWEGALLYKKAVCQGQSYLFRMLASEAGIETWSMDGDAYSSGRWEGHAWNAFEIDGKWYLLDPTWDKGDPFSYDYFLSGKESFSKNHKLQGYTADFSKSDYELPDSVIKVFIEAQLKQARIEYTETKVLLAKGLDNYLAVELGDFPEEDIDEETIEIYTELFQYKVEKYAADFYTWLGFASDEAFIEYKAYEAKYRYEINGRSYTEEEKAKALEEYHKKYPKTQ